VSAGQQFVLAGSRMSCRNKLSWSVELRQKDVEREMKLLEGHLTQEKDDGPKKKETRNWLFLLIHFKSTRKEMILDGNFCPFRHGASDRPSGRLPSCPEEALWFLDGRGSGLRYYKSFNQWWRCDRPGLCRLESAIEPRESTGASHIHRYGRHISEPNRIGQLLYIQSFIV